MDIQDIMQNQAVINLVVIGHVSNGKSTIVKQLTSTETQRHKDEKLRNITIRLGYANAKIWKCTECSAPECYQSSCSNIFEHYCSQCNKLTKLVNHISFIDAPGHALLMSTMLNSVACADYAILVESCANTEIPAPQTNEHYMITKEIGIKTMFVCLNKIDLLLKNKQKIPDVMREIKEFVGDDIPIIPMSGTMNCNIDVLCEYLAKLTIPTKNIADHFKMIVIRSFNVNHPRTKICDLKGGVLGGSIQYGKVIIDEDALVYPGFILRRDNIKDEQDIKWKYQPLECKILSINSDKNKNTLQCAIQGGLIGVQLDIDCGLTCDDGLVGQILVSKCNKNVKVYECIIVKHFKLEHVDHELKKGHKIIINANANKVKSTVFKIKKDKLYLELDKPICVEVSDKIAINIPVGNDDESIKVYGYGIVIDGVECELCT